MTRDQVIENAIESGRLNVWALSLAPVEQPEPATEPRWPAIVRWLALRVRRLAKAVVHRRPRPRPARPTPIRGTVVGSVGAD